MIDVHLIQDSQRTIEYSCVVQHNQTTIGTRFQVETYALAFLKVVSSKEVANCIDGQAQFVGYPMHAA